MSNKTQSPLDKWALFRFSVVGGLLAKPPAKGELLSPAIKATTLAGNEPPPLVEGRFIRAARRCNILGENLFAFV